MDFKGQHTVDEVFQDFKGRRDGMLKALTEDVEEFYMKCDPQKENLCLYGFPDGSWGVNLPIESVPAEIPEPVLGINFSRNGMARNAWLCLVAVHCDCWLKALAFFFGGLFKFNKNDRKRLFQLINDMPTIYELVDTKAKGPSTGTRGKRAKNVKPKVGKMLKEKAKKVKQEEDEDNELGLTFCADCGVGETESSCEFWIACDLCELWFHGKCVNITPTKAEKIKEYICPICNKEKRA